MQEKSGKNTQIGASKSSRDPRDRSIEGGTSVRDPSIDPPPPPPYDGPKGGRGNSDKR